MSTAPFTSAKPQQQLRSRRLSNVQSAHVAHCIASCSTSAATLLVSLPKLIPVARSIDDPWLYLCWRECQTRSRLSSRLRCLPQLRPRLFVATLLAGVQRNNAKQEAPIALGVSRQDRVAFPVNNHPYDSTLDLACEALCFHGVGNELRAVAFALSHWLPETQFLNMVRSAQHPMINRNPSATIISPTSPSKCRCKIV